MFVPCVLVPEQNYCAFVSGPISYLAKVSIYARVLEAGTRQTTRRQNMRDRGVLLRTIR
jgi:hypothetical protein